MKKTLSVIVVFLLVFTMAFSAFALEIGKYLSTSAQTSTLTAVEFTTSNAKIIGRTNPAYPFLIGHHSSGVEFTVTGTSTVGVRLKSYASWRHWNQDLYFEVDGQQVVIPGGTTTTQGEYDYIIATDLDPNTVHNVKVLMDQENWGQYWQRGFYFTHILVDNANATINKAKDGDHKILIYGDSITSAGNIGGTRLSYHQIMANNFNADTQAMSASGGYFGSSYTYYNGTVETGGYRVGPYWNLVAWQPTWNGENTDGVADAMQKMADANKDGVRDQYETDPNNVKFKADLILINIGTNDCQYLIGWKGGNYAAQNRATFKADFFNMMDDVFGLNGGAGYYPNTTVMLTYGLMGGNTDLENFYKEVINEYLTANPSLKGNGTTTKDKVTTFWYTPCKETHGSLSAEDSHPNTASHAYAGEELTQFVENYLGWERAGEAEVYPNKEGIIETFPEIPEVEGKLFLGYTSEDGAFVAKGDSYTWGGYIYRKYLALELGGKVDSNGNQNDDNAVPTDAEYTNSFYVQGAQVRVGLTPEDKATGLRFVVVNNTDVKSALETAITQNFQYERGVMVAPGTKFTGGELTLNTSSATKVPATKVFATAESLGENYDKFTACVINIPEQYLAVDIFVRPYFKYTDASGIEHIYYGEQYSCSIYTAAKLAYGNETDEINDYLYTNIISKCKGDNDTEIEF
jgi:hypothetical protein